MIGLNLDTYTLSSSLPESFDIETQGDYVVVAITLQGECIYQTRLYENGGSCTFYELRQIVEQNMIARHLTLASFEVAVDDGNSWSEIDGKFIIFSRYRNTEYVDIDFLQAHFLVNRSFYTMPRDEHATIPFFATGQENFAVFYDCTFERDGVLSQYRLDYAMYHYPHPNIYGVSVTPVEIKGWVENEVAEDCGRLLSFTVHVGSRSLTVFVVEDKPCIAFTFHNSYNAIESMFVMGSTTLKTEISHKEAVSLNVSSFYDKAVSRKWQVKTVPLSLEEARWYNEFLESDYIALNLSQEHSDLRILISDITSEISDNSKDLVHIKFSWRFEDNGLWLTDNCFP